MTTIAVPTSLDHLRRQPGGAAWLARAPLLVEAAVERWGLRLGDPFNDVYESMTFPASLPDGTAAVLKVHYANRENRHEATALSRWQGNGAVRLLDHDPSLGALLLERAIPGTPMSLESSERALDALIDLLPHLWIPASAPFTTLVEESATLSHEFLLEYRRTGRPFERRLVDVALDAFATLPASQGPSTLVNQDLHGDNILWSLERGWLVIDPKPLAGEREFGIAPIVRSAELGHSRLQVLHRFDRLTSDLGLDRERARLWTIAHAIAWGFEGDGILASHIDTARWLLEVRP
jgi:streptomycin 6-kinase